MEKIDYEWDPSAEVPKDLENRIGGRVAELRVALTSWVPFFGYLLLKLMPLITNEVPTAAVTRDRKLLINPFFFSKLKDGQIIGVLAHEVLHPAMLYWERQGSRTLMVVGVDMDGKPSSRPVALWNLAHDYAINMIVDDFSRMEKRVMLPPGALLDRAKYEAWSAEEIYEDLLKAAEKNEPISMPGWGQGDTKNSHGDEKSTDGDDPNGGRDFVSEAERRENENFWKQSLIEAARLHEKQRNRGSLPAGIQKMVDEILNPKIPWLDVVSRWIGENGRRQDLSYMRPSRRSESIGELLPSLIKQGVDDLVIGWDTSGSMNGREKEILAEVSGICDDLGLSVRVICCDCMIHTDTSDVQSAITLLEEGVIKGGGGSDFTPMFDRLTEEGYSGVVIAFTDGMIGVPTSKPELLKAVLWVIWLGESPPTRSWGEVICVDDHGFVKKG